VDFQERAAILENQVPLLWPDEDVRKELEQKIFDLAADAVSDNFDKLVDDHKIDDEGMDSRLKEAMMQFAALRVVEDFQENHRPVIYRMFEILFNKTTKTCRTSCSSPNESNTCKSKENCKGDPLGQ
jgi:hypothetical protein